MKPHEKVRGILIAMNDRYLKVAMFWSAIGLKRRAKKNLASAAVCQKMYEDMFGQKMPGDKVQRLEIALNKLIN